MRLKKITETGFSINRDHQPTNTSNVVLPGQKQLQQANSNYRQRLATFSNFLITSPTFSSRFLFNSSAQLAAIALAIKAEAPQFSLEYSLGYTHQLSSHQHRLFCSASRGISESTKLCVEASTNPTSFAVSVDISL